MNRSDNRSASRVARALLRWFLREARDLPWRRTRDPYAIWVSEIMLQQTQVKTVVGYWERWMQALPDVTALADAPLDRVLKLWEGLGYYSRARNMHAAARRIVETHGGVFPGSHETVLALPGVGRYTAGAVCSIAFNLPTPLLDGNVTRVLARVHALDGDPRAREVSAGLWRRSGELVTAAAELPPSHAPNLAGNCSALNQALMELGALVCTPRDPRCPECPLRGMCEARRLGQVERFPRATRRAPVVSRRVVAFVLERGGRVFLERRPEGGVNAGLWQFPSREVSSDGEASVEGVVSPGDVALRPLVTVRHSITNSRIELRAFHGTLSRRQRVAGSPLGRWLTAREAASRPFTGAHARVLRAWEGLTGTRSREDAKT